MGKYFLRTEKLKATVKPFKKQSVAHLTYPVSRRYNLHVAYQGKLRPDDTELMVKVFARKGSR